ncbi:kinase-like domain-containing protein [Xylaria scruposa]|nr:kinase-like domain-containing protein [Xylaria scruposa]
MSMTLLDRLTSAMIPADGTDNWFIPTDQLKKILDQDSVKDEITTLFSEEPAEQLERLVDDICGQERDVRSSICRKIFAVLVMIDQARSIKQFTAYDISDADIPLKPNEEGRFIITALHKRQESTYQRIELDGWNVTNYRNFLKYQWRVNAPFFTKDTSRQDHIPVLEDQTILPWIPDDGLKDKSFQTGHSEVRAIRIHHGHHDFNDTYCRSVFALKKLHKKEYKAVVPEIEILRKFSLKDETHLIQLLTTFYWNDECYLLFPWADGGSLEDLWQNNPSSQLSKEIMIWISEQCHGVAKGLYQIHERQLSDWSRAKLHQLEYPHIPGDVEFGLHGDIKPANILWFKHPQDAIGAGVLKICDFGLAQFHSRETHMRSEHGEWIGCSPTYRPPEWELVTDTQDGRRKPYSRKTDIWGLGCVYLEFITWILLGTDGIEAFSTARSADDQPNTRRALAYPEDVFFQVEYGRLHATVKGSVTEWIKKLHEHPRCSRYLHEFLDLIEKHMLVANQSERSKCDLVKDELSRISTKCCESDDYSFPPYIIDPNSNGPEPATSEAPMLDVSEQHSLVSSMLPSENNRQSRESQIYDNHIHGSETPGSQMREIHTNLSNLEGSRELIQSLPNDGQGERRWTKTLSWLKTFWCCWTRERR